MADLREVLTTWILENLREGDEIGDPKWWADRISGVAERAIAARPAQAGEVAGFVIGDGQGKRWRFWGESGPEWTTDRDAALRFSRREDAEAVARDDDDAWLIQSVGMPPAQTLVPEGWRAEIRDNGFVAVVISPNGREWYGTELGDGWVWEIAHEMLAAAPQPQVVKDCLTAASPPQTDVGSCPVCGETDADHSECMPEPDGVYPRGYRKPQPQSKGKGEADVDWSEGDVPNARTIREILRGRRFLSNQNPAVWDEELAKYPVEDVVRVAYADALKFASAQFAKHFEESYRATGLLMIQAPNPAVTTRAEEVGALMDGWRERLRGRAGPFTAAVGERWVDADIARGVLGEVLAAVTQRR